MVGMPVGGGVMPRSGPFWDAIEGRTQMPPIAELLGWSLEAIDPDAGTITVRYEATKQFTNPMGNIQGGIIAAMLDDAMGPALVATLPPGQFAPTLEMKISYFAPARVGALFADGRVVARSAITSFVEGDLRDEYGQLLARATATVRIVAPEGEL